MAVRDLWHGHTASLVQRLRECDSCLPLSGAARTVSGYTWGYTGKELPTYRLGLNGDQLSVQLIHLSPFCFQPLPRHLSAPSHFSAQARDMALIVPGKNSSAVLSQTDHSMEAKSLLCGPGQQQI